MEKSLQQVFTLHNISPHKNQGILIAPVSDQAIGIRFAKEVLCSLVDKRTALFLSGGKTPKEILKRISLEKKLVAGVVGQVDERYGEPFHLDSNESMFEDSGFLSYIQEEGIPFHSMLARSATRDVLADEYDQLLRSLFTVYQRSIATLGIGIDGHIAGIAPSAKQDSKSFKNPMFQEDRKHLLVSEFNDENGSFKERISMTFLGLSMMDYLVVLVFGEDKKEALEKVFEGGSEIGIPARFLLRSEIAQKTLIITDQQI